MSPGLLPDLRVEAQTDPGQGSAAFYLGCDRRPHTTGIFAGSSDDRPRDEVARGEDHEHGLPRSDGDPRVDELVAPHG